MNPLTQRLTQLIADALPAEFGEDIRRSVRASAAAALERMNLVTREEIEVQEAVLQRTRAKLERLEARVAELEEALREPPQA